MKKLLLIVALFTAVGCVYAVNYPTYKPTHTTTATAAPQQQTTSTTPSDLTPMLNADGSAVNPYAEAPAQAGARISGPRRVEVEGDWGDDHTVVPIGSVWVLLLFAMGYAATTAYRRRRV